MKSVQKEAMYKEVRPKLQPCFHARRVEFSGRRVMKFVQSSREGNV